MPQNNSGMRRAISIEVSADELQHLLLLLEDDPSCEICAALLVRLAEVRYAANAPKP